MSNTTRNEHTGAKLVSKAATDTYRANYDLIFKKKVELLENGQSKCPSCGCDTSKWVQEHKPHCPYFPL
jgi:hypothetical protein